MPCELCNIILVRLQRRPANESALLEQLRASALGGCEGCKLIVESIVHFFAEEMSQDPRPEAEWKVFPGWIRSPSWKRGPGAMSLVRSERFDDEDGFEGLDECMGTIFMYHIMPGGIPGQSVKAESFDILGDYSGRSLSNTKDKLPAVSGVARTFQEDVPGREFPLGVYYAGLWERDTVDQLCWGGRTATSLSRPPQYRAPSWSWASVDGEVYYSPSGLDRPIYRAQIAAVSCNLATADPYGQVSAGYLDLVTLLRPGKYQDHWKIDMMTEGKDSMRSIPFGRARLDVNPYFDSTRQPPYFENLYCAILRYGKEAWWKPSDHIFRLTVLLLEPNDPSQETFKRIGVANGHLDSEEWEYLRGLLANESQIIRIV